MSNHEISKKKRSLSVKRVELVKDLDTGRALSLSKEDLRTIQKTWRQIPDKGHFTQRVFQRVVRFRPNLSRNFCLTTLQASDEGQREIPVNEYQAKRFVEFIDKICVALRKLKEKEQGDAGEEFIRFLRSIGSIHSVRCVCFTAENWLLFKRAIIEVICETEDSSDQNYQSWMRLMNFVTAEIKDGYISGIIQQFCQPTQNDLLDEA